MNQNDSNKPNLPQYSYYHIFHSPIDAVYNIFNNMSLLPTVFFTKTTIKAMKRNTTMDDEGNEITLELNNKYIFTIRIENTVNKPTYRSFTHKSISAPPNFANFLLTFNFFWNTIEHVTIFQLELVITDSAYKMSVSDYLIGQKEKTCKSIENHLLNNLTGLEQYESISVGNNIKDVWEFMENLSNLKYFFVTDSNVEVTLGENMQIIIVDHSKKNQMTLLARLDDKSENEKEIIIEILDSVITVPKQIIKIELIKITEERTFMGFKHTIMEYIHYDVLESYSVQKKKVLRAIKAIMEGTN